MTLELNATPEEVMRAVETLQAYGRERGLAEKEIFGLALALEECASNIVNHGLKHDGRQTFHVTLEHAENQFIIELCDRGPAFDPTAVSAREQAHEDDPAGGWGVQLVRRYTDEILYRREEGENILVLKRNLSSNHSNPKK